MTAPLPCPHCQVVPQWFAACRTSSKRGVRCAFFVGCRHTDQLFGRTIFEAGEAEATCLRWNADAERLFAEMSAGWTEGQRIGFRRRLPFPAAVVVPAPEVVAAEATDGEQLTLS